MPFTLSYKARIYMSNEAKHCSDLTIGVYNDVVEYVIHIVEREWDNIKASSKYQSGRTIYVEHLIHKTSKSPNPKYKSFDRIFSNLPSYFRRAAIQVAIGDYKAWRTAHDKWIEGGRVGKEPTLTYERNHTPSFYKSNMFTYQVGSFAIIRLKLFDGKCWRWFDVRVRKCDAAYIQNKMAIPTGTVKAPTIFKEGHNWSLRVPFEFKYDLSDAEIFDQRVCAIDLGVNTDVTCCVMLSDGTIVARKTFNHAADKAKMYHQFNKIRKAQSQGATKIQRKWDRVNNINEELTRKIVRDIIDFAVMYSCTDIACEFLDTKGKIKGSKKYRLKLWRKRGIYHHLVGQAHLWGMHVHQVCAWRTSQLAFDGSGFVQRGRYIVDDNGVSLGYSYSWARFTTGKLYNADLNAAYNIGARYFIREILKALGVTSGSVADDAEAGAADAMNHRVRRANVLDLPGGSSRTLSDLINLNSALKDRQVLEALTGLTV